MAGKPLPPKAPGAPRAPIAPRPPSSPALPPLAAPKPLESSSKTLEKSSPKPPEAAPTKPRPLSAPSNEEIEWDDPDATARHDTVLTRDEVIRLAEETARALTLDLEARVRKLEQQLGARSPAPSPVVTPARVPSPVADPRPALVAEPPPVVVAPVRKQEVDLEKLAKMSDADLDMPFADGRARQRRVLLFIFLVILATVGTVVTMSIVSAVQNSH